MKITYDKAEDVLYLTFADSTEESDYIETPDGLVFRVGVKSGKILGCTIMWFKKKLEAKTKIVIPQIGPSQAPKALKRLVGVV